MDNIATASYRSLGRRRFLRTVASATAALAVPGLLASTLNGCSSKPMTPEQREALRKDIESRPKRILRFEIGAPLDAAIAASSPGVFLSTGAANRSYVRRGIYLIDELNDSLFPPSVCRDTTPMAGMGSFFSSEVRNGPIEVIYGLGREQFRLPLAWYVD